MNSLRFHCRTCMIKFESSSTSEDPKKFKVINKYPEVEQLLHFCLGNRDEAGDDLDLLVPNLCCSCFDKWLDFSILHELLIKNDEKLRKIVEKGAVLDNVAEDFTETRSVNSFCEIEKYNTSTPFYQYCNTISDLEESNLFDSYENTEAQHNLHNEFEPTSEKNAGDLIDTTSRNIRPFHGTTTYNTAKRKCKSKQRLLKLNKKEDTEIISAPLKSPKDSNKKLLYRCEPCKKYFYGIHKYEGHVKQIHEGIKKAYQCNECNKAYPFYKNLREHKALNHSLKPLESFKCEECKKIFKTKVTLKTHQASHQNVSKIICDQCGFMASNQYGLKKHIKNKHSKAEQIKCEHCPKVFKNSYYLKYHSLNFHNLMNIKPFQCTDCQMTFARIALLNVHRRTHLKPSERIKCDFEGCEVRFLFNGEKTRHMRLVHLKVKNYVCDICGEAFGTGPTLRHHRYIHTGDKPFKCNICGQGFRQRSAMKTHQKKHGSEDVVEIGVTMR